MKKVLSIVLMVTLLILFAGCGAWADASETAEEQREAVFAEVTDQTETAALPEESMTPETVFLEDSSYKVVFAGMEDSWIGKDITVKAENYTDRDMVLTNEHIAVNGVSLVCQLHVEIPAGGVGEGAMSISGSDLERAGIDSIDVLRLLDLYIRNDEGFDILREVEGEVVITSRDAVRMPEEKGEVLFESSGVTVISQAMAEGYFGTELRIFARNESDRKLIVMAYDPIINGESISGAFEDDRFVFHPDTSIYGTFILSEEVLEEKGITDPETVSFTLALLDGDAEFMVDQKYGIEFQRSQ